MKREWAARAIGVTGFRSLLSRLRPWSGIMGLNYHRIGAAGTSPFDHGLWSATPDEFNHQVAWLKANFDLICPRNLASVLSARTGRFVLITFDDGYRDNYADAFPILKRHGVPATFFISTGFLDNPRLSWWDEIAWMIRTCPHDKVDISPWLAEPIAFDLPLREQAVRRVLAIYKTLSKRECDDFLNTLGERTKVGRYDPTQAREMWMTWEMVREMHAAGMEIGGHTVNHPILANVSATEQREEIQGSLDRISAETGSAVHSFSYPNGHRGAFTNDTRDALAAAGITAAFSYYGGYREFDDWDPYDIRRLSVESDQSLSLFKAMTVLPRTFG